MEKKKLISTFGIKAKPIQATKFNKNVIHKNITHSEENNPNINNINYTKKKKNVENNKDNIFKNNKNKLKTNENEIVSDISNEKNNDNKYKIKKNIYKLEHNLDKTNISNIKDKPVKLKNNEKNVNKIVTKKIKKTDDDIYLDNILKTKNISVQYEVHKKKEENNNLDIASEETSEDIFKLDLIDEYKKKKEKELYLKKQKQLNEKKKKLIKQCVYKDAITETLLDDFTIFYEKEKSQIELIVENILNESLKQIFEESELNNIKNIIDFYENQKKEMFDSFKIHEQKNETFYKEAQQKIKDRINIRNKVENVIYKKIVNDKAHKNVQHIFQKYIDKYNIENEITSFDKSLNIYIFPWMENFMKYLINVNKKIVYYIINEMIENCIKDNFEKNEKIKRYLNEKKNIR